MKSLLIKRAIKVNTPKPSLEIEFPTKWFLLASVIVVFLLLAWAVGTMRSSQRKDIVIRERNEALYKARIEIERLSNENNDLKAKTAAVMSFHEGQLENTYPNLMKVSEGVNPVNKDYVVSYTFVLNEYGQKNVEVVLRNDTSAPISPFVKLNFLTLEGIPTATATIGPWLFDEIKPGETRVERDVVNFTRGPAVYLDLIIKK